MIDTEILQMALVGLNIRRAEVLRAIEAIEGRLGGRSKAGWTEGPTAEAKPKHKISAAARKRIVLAQRKRWAAYRAKKNAGDAVPF
jgi:hypothetical protein